MGVCDVPLIHEVCNAAGAATVGHRRAVCSTRPVYSQVLGKPHPPL